MPILALFVSLSSFAGEDQKTESRTPFVHNIPLRDSDGQIISMPSLLSADGKLQEAKGHPFSMPDTCGKCHEYEIMSKGWHFNAAMGNV
ncbi:MAG TPA: hypothetical protein VFB72_07080, partial [Verrucomicrobiae bacterium]|nr:hypothetical protein [Verrucomicrobiae bacterium]